MTDEFKGIERRRSPGHLVPLAECVERYHSVIDKMDCLIQRFDKINGKYDSHLIEAVSYRAAVDAHTKRFDAMQDQTRWMIGLMISIVLTIIAQIVTFSFLWGQWTKRVEINTERLGRIESEIEVLHPRSTDGSRKIN